jgi:hypothetical protein
VECIRKFVDEGADGETLVMVTDLGNIGNSAESLSAVISTFAN